MSDAQLVGQSIEEMLVSLAEGVREAQQALNSTPAVDAYGRPLPGYHLPYVDFNLQMDVDTQTVEGGRPIFRLLAPTGSSTRNTSTRSVVSGRLVAVPPGEGLPLPVLRLTLAQPQPGERRYAITVQAGNSAGEVLARQRIEVNLDLPASQALSQGLALPAAWSGTRLQDALLTTDDAGQGSTLLSIGTEVPVGAYVVVTATLGAVKAQGVVKS